MSANPRRYHRIAEKTAGKLKNRLLQERQMLLAVREMATLDTAGIEPVCTNILGQIDEALEHMADGSYGYCEVCGRPIPVARLRALPYAAECTACKRNEEMAALCVSA